MEQRKGISHVRGVRKKLCGRKSDGFEEYSHPGLNKGADSKFRLPVEPTESIDKHQEYPPIVTADGEVDTDIDHLMVNPEDDYVDLPVQDIPSKFPNPRVVTVIEGSLDDDIDNLMNHDGTMTHTLLDAPKNFQPGDLKEINANKEGKKHHRSYHKMDGVEAEEGFAVKNYELVPAREQNNSSEKYPEDEAFYANENDGSGVKEGEIKLFSETDKTKGAVPPDSGNVGDLASDLPNDDAKSSEFAWQTGSPSGDSYLIKITNDDCGMLECDAAIVKEEKVLQGDTDIIVEEKRNNGDKYCNKSGEDLVAKKESSTDTIVEGKDLEKESNSEVKSSQIDAELIENLTVMCIDAITKLALAEKGMGRLEQQQQLLAIANVLKHRLPAGKRSKRFNIQQTELSSNEEDAARDNIDGLSCDNSMDLNNQAKEMVQNLLQQVALKENAGIHSSVEKYKMYKATRENETENDEFEDQLQQNLSWMASGTKQLLNSQKFVSTECDATQTSHMNLSENPSISAALKVAGDSMTAAARIAEALSLLIKNTRKNESYLETKHKSLRSKGIKGYLGRAHSSSTSGRKHYNDNGTYQMYNVLEIPSFDSCSPRSGHPLRVEDVSSVEDIGSRIMYNSRGMRRRSTEVYQPPLSNNVGHIEKAVKDELSDLSTQGRKRHEHRRRSKSCKEDGTLCLELQHVMPSTKFHHRRRSESRCNEGRDVSLKEEGLGVFYANPDPNDISEHRHTKEKKRKTSSKDKEGFLDLTKMKEKDGRQRMVRSPEGNRQSRQHKSSKSEKRSVNSTCDSSVKETSKPRRHKEGNSLDDHVTTPSSENNSTRGRKKEQALCLAADKQNVTERSTPSDKKGNLEIAQSANSSTPANSQIASNKEYKDGKALTMETTEDVSMDVVTYDSPTIDETWSLPNRCTSPCESYFDRIVRGLKPWAPPSETVINKTSSDYIRSKLVGSVVDPDTRDSDFDSIEFNANARVSFCKMVRFRDSDDWNQEEEWEYDSSSSDCMPSCSRWNCEF